ncbi:MAG TPA: DUF3352 domain-containing protein [Gaiellaceae bacterium]|nr:DUF3352 domain-containing protein [Gaiellaceae bacterium]
MSRVALVRVLPALLLALVLAAAACGGEGGGAGGEAASIVPADVAFYVSVDTDFEGERWQQAEELVRKFPDGERAVEMLLSELEADEGVSFEEDVKPALGPEVAVAVLDVSADEPTIVGLTQPRDRAKLEELLARGEEPVVTDEVEGWTAFAEEQAHIDSFREALGGESLADSEGFEQALDGLEDGLVTLYVGGSALQEAAEQDPEFSQQDLGLFLPEGEFPTIGAVVHAEDEGARADANAIFAGDVEESGIAASSFEAELPDDVPGGVLAYLSFNDLESQLSAFRDSFSQVDPEVERQLGQAEAFLGVSLEEDIGPLFAGEGALYVRRGTPIPEITLLTTVEDEERAVATLDDVVAGIGQLAPVPLAEPQRTDIAGVDARQLTIQPPFSLFYGAFDGKLVLTTSREGIADLREDDERFGDDDAFEEARERSGLPDETAGWGYVDLAEALPLLLDFASAGGEAVPTEARANIEPLQSVVFYSTVDGERMRFSLFLGVE